MTIKLKSTNKAFSVYGGLPLYDNITSYLGLGKRVNDCLPRYKIDTKTSFYDKFKALVYGFLCGADCIDDMDLLSQDPGFKAINNYVNASNTYGNFLRKFSDYQCKQLNHGLIDTSLKLRKASHPQSKEFILDIDSTPHKQYGQKMEGLAYNYKNLWCLDSIQAFDQFGYQYWMQVRPGNTYTSNNSSEIIDTVFRKVPRQKKHKRYLRADSGYCNVDVFNAAKVANARFVITMKENMFSPLIDKVDNWKASKRIKFYDGRDADIGHFVYYPKRGLEVLRVVFIRGLKPDADTMLFEESKYDYYAWVSNIAHSEMNNEKLIKFYRKRGNAENYIKELKYGFDMKHFPCQKLTANKVYGLIAAFAYTIMRYSSYLLSKKKPYFSKMVRFKLIYLACQLINHGRQYIFRFNHITERRLKDLITTIEYQFGFT